MAEILLEHGANPNTNVYAASFAMQEALVRHDWRMLRLLEEHGGIVNATTAACLGLADRVRQLFEHDQAGRLPAGAVSPGRTIAEDVLEAAADGGHVELVRMALERLDWRPGDARWHGMLMRPFGRHEASDRGRYIACFQLMLDRAGVQPPERTARTVLHDVAAAWPRRLMSAADRIAFATILLDKGARLDVRDDLLESTPLGWACRWGRIELVKLFLERGADPIEPDAEPWATPHAWAKKMGHTDVLSMLRQHGASTR
jgi:ankyrin repeat protein